MSDLFDRENLPQTFNVKVTPRAKSERIKREVGQDGKPLYKVYVTAVAEDGKANEAVIKLLARELEIPKSSVIILRGLTSREKVIEIKN